jgi:hypothetical protein
MDRYEGPLTSLTIGLHRGLYFSIIMDRYEGPLTSLSIGLHRGLYFAIIMDRCEGPLTSLTIGLHRGLYFAIIMDRCEGPFLVPPALLCFILPWSILAYPSVPSPALPWPALPLTEKLYFTTLFKVNGICETYTKSSRRVNYHNYFSNPLE